MNRWPVLLVACAACLAVAGTASATDSRGTYRLSWNSCETQVVDTVFTTAGEYTLVISGDNFTPGAYDDDHEANIFTLDVRPLTPPLSDAWRFDDYEGACQRNNVSFLTAGFTKACAPIEGKNPLILSSYRVDWRAPGHAIILLGDAYDMVSPSSNTRYTFWQLIFDHARSVVGAGTPGQSCGNAEAPLLIEVIEAELSTRRQDSAELQLKPGDQDFVTWNMPPVPTVPVTWGRVKGLYR